MPHICHYPTKKAFKEAVAADPSAVFVEDPSIFDPWSGSVGRHLRQRGPFTVTNHPKRSWFAEVKLAKNGTVKVS